MGADQCGASRHHQIAAVRPVNASDRAGWILAMD
jgi:hypothetical protein